MTRSSTRIQAKRSSNADHGDTVDEDDFVGHVSDAWSEEDATAPPRKKRKTTKLSAPKKRQGKKLVKTESFDPKWTHTRGRRGLLKQLSTEAPLDILFEVTDLSSHRFVILYLRFFLSLGLLPPRFPGFAPFITCIQRASRFAS